MFSNRFVVKSDSFQLGGNLLKSLKTETDPGKR